MKLKLPRLAAALTATALFAGLGSTLTAAVAAADTVGPVKGNSDAVAFERSVSGTNLVNGKISTGDVITVNNTLRRYSGWLVYWVKDVHPTCMEPVPNTSTWKVSGKTYTNNPEAEGTKVSSEVISGAGWVQIKPPGANSWEATPLVWTQDYLVKCSAGSLNTGGVEWSSTWAFEKGNSHPNAGPTLQVGAGRPSITVNPSDAKVANEVTITVRHPEGLPGDPVALTSDGKTLPGCGNLTLDGDRKTTCTWKPSKAGDYPLKAVIGAVDPVTVTGNVSVADNPMADSGSLGLSGGSFDYGS